MKAPTQFVVMQECSAGNSQVGDMWVEAGTFPPTAMLAEVWAWASSRQPNSGCGRTMLRPDANIPLDSGKASP